MHNRTKAVAIPSDVKKAVEKRDNYMCIFCKETRNVHGEAHIIARSQGGLGIEKNLVTVCRKCHDLMDNSQARSLYVEKAKEYMKSIYPDWNEHDLVYNKWDRLKYN